MAPRIMRMAETAAARRQTLGQKLSRIVATIAAEHGKTPEAVTTFDLAEYQAAGREDFSPAELAAVVIYGWSTREFSRIEDAITNLGGHIREIAVGAQAGAALAMIREIERTEAVCPHCNGAIDFAGVREALALRASMTKERAENGHKE